MNPDLEAAPMMADSEARDLVSRVIGDAGGENVADALFLGVIGPGDIRFDQGAAHVTRRLDSFRLKGDVREVEVSAQEERDAWKSLEPHDAARLPGDDAQVG